MSVILDALRRSRKGGAKPGTTPMGTAARSVPAGLGLAGSTSAHGPRPARTRLFGLGVLLVITVGTWAAIQLSRSLIDQTPPAPTEASRALSLPPAPSTPSLPHPEPVPVPPPPSSVASGAPMTASSEAEDPRRSSRPVRSAGPTVVLRSAPTAPPGPAPATQRSEPAAPEAVAEAPENPVSPSDFALAVRHHTLGNYDEALKLYLAVLDADEFNVEARNNLGLLHHRRGSTNQALDQLRRAVAINPKYVRARSNLAVVLTEARRFAEARAELRAAMSLEPRNPDLIVNLALVEKADQRPDQAIELLVRAIGQQPTHGMAHYNVAVLYEEQNALARAYDHYTEFLKYAGPEHGELLSDVQERLLILKPRLASSR